MKDLVIQIHLERDHSYNCEHAVEQIRLLGLSPKLSLENDGAEYGNIFLQSEDMLSLWRTLSPMFNADTQFSTWLRNVAITTCQGDEGWDDYLLLQHFDPSEIPDTLE